LRLKATGDGEREKKKKIKVLGKEISLYSQKKKIISALLI